MSAVESKLRAMQSLRFSRSDAARQLRPTAAAHDAVAARSSREEQQIEQLKRESNAALEAFDEAFPGRHRPQKRIVPRRVF